jgi:hypothetical protein
VDTGLVSRADATAADIASNGVLETPQPTAAPLPRVTAELNTITAIYSPAGALVDAQPSALPGAPLTTQQRLHPVAARSLRTVTYD